MQRHPSPGDSKQNLSAITSVDDVINQLTHDPDERLVLSKCIHYRMNGGAKISIDAKAATLICNAYLTEWKKHKPQREKTWNDTMPIKEWIQLPFTQPLLNLSEVGMNLFLDAIKDPRAREDQLPFYQFLLYVLHINNASEEQLKVWAEFLDKLLPTLEIINHRGGFYNALCFLSNEYAEACLADKDPFDKIHSLIHLSMDGEAMSLILSTNRYGSVQHISLASFETGTDKLILRTPAGVKCRNLKEFVDSLSLHIQEPLYLLKQIFPNYEALISKIGSSDFESQWTTFKEEAPKYLEEKFNCTPAWMDEYIKPNRFRFITRSFSYPTGYHEIRQFVADFQQARQEKIKPANEVFETVQTVGNLDPSIAAICASYVSGPFWRIPKESAEKTLESKPTQAAP